MADVVQVAYQMEEELKKKTPMRASTENITRSERTFVNASRSKSIDKPQRSSYVSNMPPHPSASSSSQASSNKSPLEEEVCDPLDANYETSFDDLDDLMSIICPLMISTKQVSKRDEDLYHRGKIFQTRVNCEGQICSLVIDTGSCTNVVSEDAVKKSGLMTEPHPEPYHVAWITNTKLKVDKQCPVTFTIGNLKETIMCDVLPLKLSHTFG